MAKEYTKAGKEALTICAVILKTHYEVLLRAKIKIAMLFADAGFGTPAIMEHGRPAAASIKASTVIERTLGISDAIMVIDANVWLTLNEASKHALVHHELQHIEIKCDGDGAVIFDTANRPALTMREHDYDLSGFGTTIGIYGADAVEQIEFDKFRKKTVGQLVFGFDEKPEVAKPVEPSEPVDELPPIDACMDDMIKAAMKFIRETRRATTSSLQRRLHIGYTKAARVMDELEERGHIGPPRGSEPREILMDLDNAAA